MSRPAACDVTLLDKTNLTSELIPTIVQLVSPNAGAAVE
jgi:hypothetical protein